MVTKKTRSQSQITLKKIKETVTKNQKWIIFGIAIMLITTNINAVVEIFEPEDNRIEIEEPESSLPDGTFTVSYTHLTLPTTPYV